MRNTLVLLCFLLSAGSGLTRQAAAQHTPVTTDARTRPGAGAYHVALSKAGQPGTLKVNGLQPNVVIERHAGQDVVVTLNDARPNAEKAKGLRSLVSTGTDNTGIGLEIREAGNTVEITEAVRQDGTYRVLVPEHMAIQIDYNSPHSGNLTLRNIASEIRVNGGYSSIKLEGITGPAVVHTMGGDVEARFTKVSRQGPVSLSSTGGELDVTLPADTPADVKLSTGGGGGEIYTDMQLAVPKKEGLDRFGGQEDISGKLNGGGVPVNLQSVGGVIYLRTNN